MKIWLYDFMKDVQSIKGKLFEIGNKLFKAIIKLQVISISS